MFVRCETMLTCSAVVKADGSRLAHELSAGTRFVVTGENHRRQNAHTKLRGSILGMAMQQRYISRST